MYWNYCEGCGEVCRFPSLKEFKRWYQEEDRLCPSCELMEEPKQIPSADHLCPQCHSAPLSTKSNGKTECPKCGFCPT